MKKVIVGMVACALVAAFALAGCSSGSSQSASSASSSSDATSALSASDTPETSSEAASSASAQEGTVEWTPAATADEAAQGAGFDNFGVMDEIKLGDLTFANPTFSYAGGVAQAMYEQGAAAVFVRKAEGKHTAPLTDRDKVDFDVKWVENLNGVDVTLYGDKEGAATVIDWNVDTQDYTVTYQGLGGEEMTMTSDEAETIVKGFMDADAAEGAAADQGDSGQDQQPDNPGGDVPGGGGGDYPISAEMAESIAVSVMGGTATSVELTYSDLYGECWYVALDGDDTVPIGCYVNMYGAAYAATKDHNPDAPVHQSITQDQAAMLAAQAFGGYAQSVTLTQDANYGECWLVTVQNDAGETATYIVNMLGNAYRVDGK